MEKVNATTGTDTLSSASGGRSLDDVAWIYVSPVILLLGVVGNSLVLAVMRRRTLAASTTSVYLTALAGADTAALVLRIVPQWCKAAGVVDIGELSRWTCKTEKFSFYTASDAAIWILVVFTVDRFIAVSFPLQKRRVCVRRNAVRACCVVSLLAVVKNAHVFWTRDIELIDNDDAVVCGRPAPYRHFEQYVRPWLAFVSISVIPALIITVCNVAIVRQLARLRLVHRTGVARAAVTELLPAGRTAAERTARQSLIELNQTHDDVPLQRVGGAAFAQTSVMCVAASLTFLVCVPPSVVLTVGRAYWSRHPAYIVACTINHQLACLNHAINFILYCVAGQRFRAELAAMLHNRQSTTLPLAPARRPSHLPTDTMLHVRSLASPVARSTALVLSSPITNRALTANAS